jgi:hypothetical protein
MKITSSWSVRVLILAATFVVAGTVSAVAQVQVNSTSPSAAPQGTTNLNVTVNGNGFKKGAKAQWFVTGTTNPGGVTVNSTAFNASGQLTANITIASGAVISGYDVQVTNADGRTGKGTDLFAVTQEGTSAASCNYSVTSVLFDTDSNSMRFQYQSDGLGAYTTGTGRDSVGSDIQKSCSWTLDTTVSTSRGIVVTLADPYTSGSTAPFAGPQEIHGNFTTQCFDNTANNGLNFGTMTFTGQTLACPMHLVFTYNGVLYSLALAPPKWPGTSFMQVTCTGATGGECNAWTVQPDPSTSVVNPSTNQLSGIAELFLPSCNGCGTGTSLGEYLVAFSFLIHK